MLLHWSSSFWILGDCSDVTLVASMYKRVGRTVRIGSGVCVPSNVVSFQREVLHNAWHVENYSAVIYEWM